MLVRLPATVLLLAALVAAGCGPGAGTAPESTSLLVTRDYGAATLLDDDEPESGGSDTVMRLLQRNASTETRYAGKFVQEIDGIAGGSRDGRTVDWFYYVNGSFADEGASSTRVHEGDVVWWDHHAWEPGVEPHALVGAYPQPFVGGLGGRRLPVRVECADVQGEACTRVRDALVELGVPAARGGIARSLTRETLRVLVGPWSQLRGDAAVATLGEGPHESGVFARFADEGRSLELLDSAEKVTRRLGPGAGLIAATVLDEDSQPLWAVTGTDSAGTAAAARAFREETLRKRFAVAVSGAPIPLPDER